MVTAVQFVSLLLMALATGVVFSHMLQPGPKATLPASVFLSVQQILLRNYGAALGTIEAGAFASTLVMAFLVRTRPAGFALTAIACVCVAAMIAVWAVWINPINKAVNSWTADSMPSNWSEFRDRWHRLHTLRAGLALAGLSALIVAGVVECQQSGKAGAM